MSCVVFIVERFWRRERFFSIALASALRVVFLGTVGTVFVAKFFAENSHF